MLVRESNSGSINSRDLSRTDLAHMVQSLRKELKEQMAENQELNDSVTWWKNRYEAQVKINEEHQKLNGELRKENDGLTTVIDLVKQYIGGLIYTNEITDNILEILEKVNEDE